MHSVLYGCTNALSTNVLGTVVHRCDASCTQRRIEGSIVFGDAEAVDTVIGE